MERVKTGIIGLDHLLEGGFPKGRNILVSGACGCGKTIFATQFLYNGATQYNEPGVIAVLDEKPDKYREDMLRFGWDLEKLENKKKLAIVDISSARVGWDSKEKFRVPEIGIDVGHLFSNIVQVCEQIKAKRLVIDSLVGLGFHLAAEQDIRKAILKMNYLLSRTDLTAIVTSEVPEQTFGVGPMNFSKYGVEEYITDGVIIMHYFGVGTESTRSMFIRKMRGTKHCEDLLPIEISKKGIVVRRPEEVYKT